jgi:hypothetical protein
LEIGTKFSARKKTAKQIIRRENIDAAGLQIATKTKLARKRRAQVGGAQNGVLCAEVQETFCFLQIFF